MTLAVHACSGHVKREGRQERAPSSKPPPATDTRLEAAADLGRWRERPMPSGAAFLMLSHVRLRSGRHFSFGTPRRAACVRLEARAAVGVPARWSGQGRRPRHRRITPALFPSSLHPASGGRRVVDGRAAPWTERVSGFDSLRTRRPGPAIARESDGAGLLHGSRPEQARAAAAVLSAPRVASTLITTSCDRQLDGSAPDPAAGVRRSAIDADIKKAYESPPPWL